MCELSASPKLWNPPESIYSPWQFILLRCSTPTLCSHQWICSALIHDFCPVTHNHFTQKHVTSTCSSTGSSSAWQVSCMLSTGDSPELLTSLLFYKVWPGPCPAPGALLTSCYCSCFCSTCFLCYCLPCLSHSPLLAYMILPGRSYTCVSFPVSLK